MSATRLDPPATRRGSFAGWRDAHLASAADGLLRLGRRPLGTLMTVLVLALAIALPVCLGVVIKEVERFSGALNDSRDLTVFLRPQLDAVAAEAFAAQHRGDPRIARLELRSPDQGLAELREMRDLGEALQALDRNPLPWVAVIVPTPSSDDHALAESLRALPEVDLLQHDARWRERLAAWLALGRQVALLAALLLGLGVLLVIGNTVRLEVQGRAEEIATLRLLGATRGFVRRPFLYLGAWYGLLAGVVGLMIVIAAGAALAAPLQQLVSSYGSEVRLLTTRPLELVGVLGVAVLLGVSGAFLAVGHQLRQAESQA